MKRKMVLVLIVALVIWMLFFYMGAPLDAVESLVIVGLAWLLFSGTEWVWQRLRGRPQGTRRNHRDST